MGEVITNTSPLQYLHQIEHLDILKELTGGIIVPAAVVKELEVGRNQGVDLPDPEKLDWVDIRTPVSEPTLRLVVDLGPGESSVLALAGELHDPVVILDDALARKTAAHLGIRMIGTLGLLVQAKKRGLVREVRPLLDRLEALRFRLAPRTRDLILARAGEIRGLPSLLPPGALGARD